MADASQPALNGERPNDISIHGPYGASVTYVRSLSASVHHGLTVDVKRIYPESIADHVGGVAREGIRTLRNERYYQIIYQLTLIGDW